MICSVHMSMNCLPFLLTLSRQEETKIVEKGVLAWWAKSVIMYHDASTYQLAEIYASWFPFFNWGFACFACRTASVRKKYVV